MGFDSIALIAVLGFSGLVIHWIVFALAERLAGRTRAVLDDRIVRAFRAPSRLLFPLLAVLFALPLLSDLDPELRAVLRHALGIIAIVTVTWMFCAVVGGVTDAARSRYDITVADNLEARRLHTQLLVLERTIIAVIVIVGLASALMTFPQVRQIGASLLVSAGFAGLAIGMAARPVLENLISGLQLAFTQPIRIDDVVIVEGEWGRIEEITATYVVVRIWDERRLIVPLSHFMTRPFQNWTRRSAEILGTVFLHADYTVPVEAVREELRRLCEASELWDGRVCNLQVTDANEHTIQMRGLVSAKDAGRAWDLRVHLREQLIYFLQREYPDCLPRARLSLDRVTGPASAQPGGLF